MAVFSIYDGRNSFWQWDVDQRLIVSADICNEVHFCNGTTKCALVCHVYEHENKRVVDVPNILLQTAGSLRVFVYRHDENGRRTMLVEIFSVAARSKPDDYVYTETEVWTAEKAVKKAFQEAKDNGEFGYYIPERGVDYWTEADKAEIKSYVDEAILGGAW